MIQQIGRKLRQQIHYFSGELCTGFGKVSSRFIEEAIFGISASRSVRLTEIGRALEERIDLYATHKRLSSNLANEKLEFAVSSTKEFEFTPYTFANSPWSTSVLPHTTLLAIAYYFNTLEKTVE